MQPPISLASGSWSLLADPDHGGRIVDCRFEGRPVFHPGRTGIWPEQEHAGCFPLVPFSNRIRNGAFNGPDGPILLGPPEFSAAHAIHGSGWRKSWKVTDASPTQLRMKVLCSTAGWPWPFEATQTWQINDETVQAEISITNLASTPMPAGIGLHPYLANTATLKPQVRVGGLWHIQDNDEPFPRTWQELEPGVDFFSGPAGNLPHLDHCLTGWTGHIRLEDPANARNVDMSASRSLGNLIVYRPSEGGIFCAEPVSHISNAFNMSSLPADQDLVRLEPGACLTGWVRLTVTPCKRDLTWGP